MALYVSVGTRRRRAVLVAIAVGIVAFVLGLLIGRHQVPSVASRVGEVKAAADNVATGLQRLDIEYQQVLSGNDQMTTGVLTPLDETLAGLQRAMDRAPWLTSAQRAAMLDAVAGVRQAAVDKTTLADFRAKITAAAALVRTTFGVAQT